MRLCALFAGMMLVAGAAAAGTWSGKISDSLCGTTHASMMNDHRELRTERDCTMACVRAGGSYVFVAGGKVYKIAKPNLTQLQAHAGEVVRVTGDIQGDTIAISDIKTVGK